MRKLTHNQWFLALTAVCGLALTFAGLGPYSAVAFIVCLIVLSRWMRLREGDHNWKAIKGALTDYEEIIGGQLWKGGDAEILASDRVDDRTKPGPVRFEHICRTKNGAWFLFYVAVTHGHIVDLNLTPCDEATARRRLERHQEAYVRCFGQPTAA